MARDTFVVILIFINYVWISLL